MKTISLTIVATLVTAGSAHYVTTTKPTTPKPTTTPRTSPPTTKTWTPRKPATTCTTTTKPATTTKTTTKPATTCTTTTKPTTKTTTTCTTTKTPQKPRTTCPATTKPTTLATTVKKTTATSPATAVCKNAVSTTTKHTNDYCMQACELAKNKGKQCSDLPEWKCGDCIFQDWTVVDGKVDVSGSLCFSNWVYGYSEPAKNSAFDEEWHHTDTPAECQLLCQNSANCVNWIWASDLVFEAEPLEVFKCSLKNETQVLGALSVITQDDHWPEVGRTMDTDWCNYGMEHECATNHYQCLSCNQKKRCVWHSDMHVAGWKYCVDHDSCASVSQAPARSLRAH